jgi:hypothetical protein
VSPAREEGGVRIGCGRLADRDQVQRPDLGGAGGGEHDGSGPDLGLAGDRHARSELRGRREQRGGRHGRSGADPEQPQELDLRGLGDLVEPVEHRLAEEREQLEQGDPGIALVVVGPLPGVDGNSLQ